MGVRSQEVRKETRIDKLEELILGVQLIHVQTTIEVYDRNAETGDPELVETMQDLDLLIDPSDGYRVLRSEANAESFDDMAADAKLVPIPITCHRKQLEMITDATTRVIGAISGQRAGKTHALAFWMLRQWMLRGDSAALFWWVAPQLSHTAIGVNKLFRGDGERVQSVFPPELVTYFPKDPNQARQYGELIDGSRIGFLHAGMKGENLRGFAPRAIGVDEGTGIKHRENWTVMLGRCSTHQAQIFVATTPVAGHWLRVDVVQRAETSDFVKNFQISIFDNVWEHTETVKELIEAAGGDDDPMVRRDYYGEWLPSSAQLWPHWSPKDHLVHDADIHTIEQMVEAGRLPEGYVDVTARMAADLWRGHENATVMIGQDFNIWPMASVVARAFGDPAKPETWGLLFVDELLTRGSIQNHCEKLSKIYPGAPVSVDSTGALPGTHPSQGAAKGSTNRTEMERFGFDAIACHMVEGKVSAPSQNDSLNLVYRLQIAGRIFVHARCTKLREALDNQEREQDGTILRVKKQSNTASDRLSAPSDGLRYLIWPLFQHELGNRKKTYGKKSPGHNHDFRGAQRRRFA